MMSKNKKTELTGAHGRAARKTSDQPPAERLQQALVPQEEWPYDVPENWVWATLGDITEIISGGTPSSTNPDYYDGGETPWITPADLSGYEEMYISHGRKNITELGLTKSSARLMPKGTVLLSSRAPIGYVAIAANEVSTNQGFKSFLPAPYFQPEYLYFWLKAYHDNLESYASGTTFLELSGRMAATLPFPIAPLPEQQRIVTQIETLFHKLDTARTLVQSTLDSFENRRAAILHKAFTGELTAQWRAEHGVAFDTWEETTLLKVTTSMQNGISKRKGSEGVSTVVLRLANVKGYHIVEDDLREIVLTQKEVEKYTLQRNDIVILRVNGSVENVGKFILISESQGWAFCDHMIKLTLDQSLVNPQYISYIAQTDSYRKFIEDNMVSSAGQNTISQKSLESFFIKLPTLSEQVEIVRLLDNLFDKEETAKGLSNTLTQIDHMKKSILARAFRGQLGTNGPTEPRELSHLPKEPNQ